MEKLKQSSWSLNTKRNAHWLCFLFLSVALVSCKKTIYSVDVRVYNVNTNEGIPDIELFTESGGEYTTDDDGHVTVKGVGNLYGRKISTKSSMEGYVNSEQFETCETISSYQIDNSEFEIPLLKLDQIKISVFENQKSPFSEACVVIPGRACPTGTGESDIAMLFRLDKNGNLDSPRFSVGNSRTFPLPKDAEEQEVKIYYDQECNSLGVEPDTSFIVPIVKNDTTKIVIYI